MPCRRQPPSNIGGREDALDSSSGPTALTCPRAVASPEAPSMFRVALYPVAEEEYHGKDDPDDENDQNDDFDGAHTCEIPVAARPNRKHTLISEGSRALIQSGRAWAPRTVTLSEADRRHAPCCRGAPKPVDYPQAGSY